MLLGLRLENYFLLSVEIIIITTCIVASLGGNFGLSLSPRFIPVGSEQTVLG